MHDRLPLPQPNPDRISTSKRNTSTGKRRLLGEREREKVFDLPKPVLDRTSTIGQPVPQLVESVGHSLDRLSFFDPENLFF